MPNTIDKVVIFPESPRVIYDKNPLEEVICQLKFPPILRIESESPAAFQESIRGSYPLFSERPRERLPVPDEVAKLIAENIPLALANPSYEFASADAAWKITLTRDFLALTSTKYQKWEEFCEYLETPLNALTEIYSPSFYTRIGLRYRDVIKRSELGLGGFGWRSLLKPHITGELSLEEIAPRIKHVAREIVIVLEDETSKVRIRHGLARSGKNGEECYVVDSDFFRSQRTEAGNVNELLATFNRQAGRLFRWCITEQLHKAMGPRLVE